MVVGKLLARTFYFLQKRMGLTIGLRRRDPDKYKANNFFNNFLNDFIYWLLILDDVRNRAYENSMARNINAKSKVLEIGTGNKAFLTLMAHKRSPLLLTTIEENKESYLKARRLIEGQNAENIKIVYGNAKEISLDEKYDVLVQEIFGSIGSAEGGAVAVSETKARLLTSDCKFIPDSCLTYMVPVSTFKPGAAERVLNYLVSDNIGEVGFFRIYNFPKKLILSKPQVFEDLTFCNPIVLKEELVLQFVITQSGAFDGVLFFIELNFDNVEKVNALNDITNWSTPYVRVFEKPVQVEKGDVVEITSFKDLSTEDPVYEIRIEVTTPRAKYKGNFKWGSRNRWAIKTDDARAGSLETIPDKADYSV